MTNLAPIMDYPDKPFSTLDRALWLRDVLTRETGLVYRVDRAMDGEGYVLRRVESPVFNSPESRDGMASDFDRDRDDAFPEREFGPLVLRPALRTSLPFHLPFLLTGLFLAADARSALPLVLAALGVGSLPHGIDPGWLIGAAGFAGVLLSAITMANVFLPWLSSRYLVSTEGVSMRHGIIARDTVEIRCQDIRSIGLKQGILERLLNVGTLEFTSAGTDDAGVVFTGIARPGEARMYVQKLMGDR